ncbi:MAG: copper amine oxidase N-terminal domain-containing protein [Peptococcaceae bacterium]|nr:copper amine oxidase N-terminal domain-containing protein [Peptococcaceae bacterium]
MKNRKLFAILTLVCFMFTLMPMAAFAAEADYETSSFVAVDGDQTVRLNKVDGEGENADKEGVKFSLDLLDAAEDDTTDAGDKTVVVWAVNANGTVTSALDVVEATGNFEGLDNVFVVPADVEEVTALFTRTGTYTVYAGLVAADADEMSDIKKFDCEFSKITVKSAAANPEADYTAALSYTDDEGYAFYANVTTANYDFVVYDENDEEVGALYLTPNNVMTEKIFVNFESEGKALKGETIAIETNSAAIEVNKASDVTNSQGQIDFTISASIEGNYEVILTVDGVEWVLNVVVGNTAATAIETVTAPTSPLAQYGTWEDDEIEFYITDINGNAVENWNGLSQAAAENKKYIVLTEAPADSDLESGDLYLVNAGDGIYGLEGVDMDAEGTYSVKVILDNGAYATATWEVKKFQKPVMLVIGASTDVVELGGSSIGELLYFDANGVQKAANDADFTATGYATKFADNIGGNKFQITAKSDEKYVGSVITATAVSTKYDLVATKEFKVAEGAVGIAFVDKSADVNVNNKLTWNVVDGNGTRVTLNSTMAGVEINDIKYVVLDKPEGAKVSTNDVTNDADLTTKGIGKMSLTSNKVGNVTVQVVLKATFNAADAQTKQVKYYTGTQIIAVGTQGVGDVVVMSVGSNEIVINDAKATIDAAPIVENSRTFVPFRALAEAFGAEVAYDEATQAVTAELNGVTVVMTIGSAEYTVNGEAKTADVAPFINGSRTMVPVRFAAEAFGIKVIPTYDENGATADILFNL